MAMKGKEGQVSICGCRKDERQSVKENVKKKLGRTGKKKGRTLWKEEKGNQRNYREMGRKRWKTGKN